MPLAYASIAYSAVWIAHLGGWNSEFVSLVSDGFGLPGVPAWGSLTLYILTMSTGGMILNLATALGEEIGWRGLLVPELAKRMSFTKVGILRGVIWAAWHAPLLLFADYHAGTNRWYALACSTVAVVSGGFILAWLRLKSDSIWAPAIFHASHNVFVPCVFDNLIRNIDQLCGTRRNLALLWRLRAPYLLSTSGLAAVRWNLGGRKVYRLHSLHNW